MSNRKVSIEKDSYRIKDPSMHRLLVALGMTSLIAIAVIVFAYAAFHGTVSQGFIGSLPTIEGLEKQFQESYNAFNMELGALQQWLAMTFDFLSSIFS
jgi:hypothetical protein